MQFMIDMATKYWPVGTAVRCCTSGACILLVVALLGCGDNRLGRVPVAGQVTLDGVPLTVGFVRFFSSEGRPSSGKLNEEGRFVLSCYEKGDGALLGVHQVAVSAQKPVGDQQIRWHAPEKYSHPASSGLTQEVTEPTDSVLIELTWNGDNHDGPYMEHR